MLDTDKDVANIKEFFEDRLRFDTYDPRSYEGEDLSTDALVNYLKSTQESLNGAMSKKYYCFVCIILSHGNEVTYIRGWQIHITALCVKQYTMEKRLST